MDLLSPSSPPDAPTSLPHDHWQETGSGDCHARQGPVWENHFTICSSGRIYVATPCEWNKEQRPRCGDRLCAFLVWPQHGFLVLL